MGGHCIYHVRLSTRHPQVLAQNSWGLDWSIDGRCKINYSVILDEKLTFDLWTVQRVSYRCLPANAAS
jgi:hypothetical protein